MLNRRTLIIFFAKVIAIYLIFLLPFSFIDEIYGSYYRGICNKVFASVATTGFVWFKPTDDPRVTKITIGNHALDKPNGDTQVRNTEMNIRVFAYLPTLLLLALIAASPVSIKRRLIATAIGLFIITMWVLFKQWIHIIDISLEFPWLKLYDLSESKRNFIFILFKGICITLSPSFIVAVLTWLMVTFRKDDLIWFKV